MFSSAKKSLGQNFLVDANFQNKIISTVKAEHVSPCLIEIGPGRGALTQHLVPLASQLLLIEKDRELVAYHQDKWHDQPHVRVIQADATEFSWISLPFERAQVVSNLPYNVASQILIQLFQEQHVIENMYLMFQKEMADRILAPEASRQFGPLAIWTQIFSKAHKAFDIPPGAFQPRPKVTSSFLTFKKIKVNDVDKEVTFIEFCRELFCYRRKTIGAILKQQKYDFTSIDDLVKKRPEELKIELLRQIYENVKKKD